MKRPVNSMWAASSSGVIIFGFFAATLNTPGGAIFSAAGLVPPIATNTHWPSRTVCAHRSRATASAAQIISRSVSRSPSIPATAANSTQSR